MALVLLSCCITGWIISRPIVRAGALNMAFDPAHDQVVQSNALLVRLFSALSMARACDLHQRLQAGRTDPETRQLLRRALTLSKQEQAAN